MKPVRIVRRNFQKIARVQPDWHGTTGRADWDARTIYLHDALPHRTIWSERVILEHEKAHFVIMDSGVDDQITPAQDELLADFLGLVRTPNKHLHINERYMKQWLLGNYSWKNNRLQVLMKLLLLLNVPDYTDKAKRMLRCL